MPQLIIFRGIQGLGAGAVIPLSMTIIGELYALEERARTQALFSGMWGLASIAGPMVGGYITDALSWRWVFFLNLPVGALAVVVIALAFPPSARPGTAAVDWPGAALLFGGTSTLLIALGGVAESIVPWLIATTLLLGSFVFVERRASHPILPLELFRYPIVSRSLPVVFMTGMAMFGAIAFVPLFVQIVMNGSATEAGQVLTPLFLGWVFMSIAAARLTIRIGYRPVTIGGNALLTAGFVALATIDQNTTRTVLFLAVFILGCGMGLAMLSLLLAVQHGVDRSLLGLATSFNQFSRSVGAAIGVAAMGAMLARNLSGIPLTAGAHGLPSAVVALEAPARAQFALALGRVFAAGAVMSLIGLAASFALPPVHFGGDVSPAEGGRMLAAEMTMLQSEDGGSQPIPETETEIPSEGAP